MGDGGVSVCILFLALNAKLDSRIEIVRSPETAAASALFLIAGDCGVCGVSTALRVCFFFCVMGNAAVCVRTNCAWSGYLRALVYLNFKVSECGVICEGAC